MLFSQKLMSEYLEIKSDTLDNYEKGLVDIPVDVLEKLCDLLSCDYNSFLNDDIDKVLSTVPTLNIYHNYSVYDLKTIASINKISLNLREMQDIWS